MEIDVETLKALGLGGGIITWLVFGDQLAAGFRRVTGIRREMQDGRRADAESLATQQHRLVETLIERVGLLEAQCATLQVTSGQLALNVARLEGQVENYKRCNVAACPFRSIHSIPTEGTPSYGGES